VYQDIDQDHVTREWLHFASTRRFYCLLYEVSLLSLSTLWRFKYALTTTYLRILEDGT